MIHQFTISCSMLYVDKLLQVNDMNTSWKGEDVNENVLGLSEMAMDLTFSPLSHAQVCSSVLL